MIVYLSVAQVVAIHRLQLEQFGGSNGIRDRGLLESAVMRPQMTFDGDDLYPDVPAKAAALLHSLVQNRPFVDGNKRVGAHALVLFLVANEHDLEATSPELVDMTLAVARGELGVEEIGIWVRQRARRRQS